MREPCSNCPFRSDRPFLGFTTERAEEIVNNLFHDGGFYCHKTVDYSDENGDGRSTTESIPCYGAALFLENTCRGGLRANVFFRLQVAYKQIDLEEIKKCKVPVYRSVKDFIHGTSILPKKRNKKQNRLPLP